MPRFDLKTARIAALHALGDEGEQVLANLEAVGLVIVRKQDLPRESADTQVLHDVRLHLSDDWRDPYNLTVTGGDLTEPLALGCEYHAINSVRQAHVLQQTLGYRVDLTVDLKAQLVTHAQAVER